MHNRIYRFLITCGLAIAFLLTSEHLLPVPGYYGISTAEAQRIRKVRQNRKRTLLQVLFGATPRDRRAKRIKSRRRKASRRKSRRRKQRRAAIPVLPAAIKQDDAQVVLVVGDFFAGGLAKGLKRSFSQTPNVKIVGKSSGSSGFVRPDYYDWTGKITPLIDKWKPSVVVAMIGTNDRQLMRLNGKKLQKRTEAWDVAYKARIENFTKTVGEMKVPLVWIGLPPVRLKKMNGDFLYFNEIYRSKTEMFGGQYIDVWDGFSDSEGNYAQSGPDVNGQIVVLRSRDGINITKAGQNKLAFYAEKGVKKFVGGSAAQFVGLPLEDGGSAKPLQPTYDPAKTGRTIAVRLDDPALDGGNFLAGAGKKAGSTMPPKAGDLIIGNSKGPPVGPEHFVAGRADDYSWPPKQAGLPSVPKVVTEKRQ